MLFDWIFSLVSFTHWINVPFLFWYCISFTLQVRKLFITTQTIKMNSSSNITGIQVWNVHFRQQVAHQSSLCFKDMGTVPSTTIRPARVINWKSVCIVLCCCVQYFEIYTEHWTFADSVKFLFRLKKTVAESYRLLREAFGEHSPSQDTCEWWFRRFKSGDFDTW